MFIINLRNFEFNVQEAIESVEYDALTHLSFSIQAGILPSIDCQLCWAERCNVNLSRMTKVTLPQTEKVLIYVNHIPSMRV